MEFALDLQTDTLNEPFNLTILGAHGVGSDGTVWLPIAAALNGKYTVESFDQPGHGKSPQLTDPTAYGPRLAYRALEQVVGDRTLILLGHSLGGYLAARFSVDHPSQARALILVATGPGFRSAESRAAWNADIEEQSRRKGRPEMLVGLHEDSYVMDHLSDISCPTLLLVGSEDKAFLGSTDYIERKIVGCRKEIIVGAGHKAPVTHGVEIAALISEFLRGVG